MLPLHEPWLCRGSCSRRNGPTGLGGYLKLTTGRIGWFSESFKLCDLNFIGFKLLDTAQSYLRCAQLANASRVLGNLGDDTLSKITLKSGVGTMETGSDDGRFMALRGPVTLRHMRFRLTDLDGNVVIKKGGADRPEAQEYAAPEAPHAALEAPRAAPEAPEPKRRGRPPGSKNKPKLDMFECNGAHFFNTPSR